MPKEKSNTRDYVSEYNNFHSRPGEKKKRARRNKARRDMIKLGRAAKGDGKDVAHKDNNTKNGRLGNLSLQSKASNRSFARTKGAGRKGGKGG